MTEPEFISHLRAEKLKAQDTRGTYTEKKLAYATALLGFGALGTNLGQLSALGGINLGLLLYLVPVVALAFDLYILGEDYSVKRIGAFLARKTTDPLEKEWEAWAAKNRTPRPPRDADSYVSTPAGLGVYPVGGKQHCNRWLLDLAGRDGGAHLGTVWLLCPAETPHPQHRGADCRPLTSRCPSPLRPEIGCGSSGSRSQRQGLR